MPTRSAKPERTIVQLILADETGDSYYRMRWPGRELALQEPSWAVVNLDARAKERYDYAEQADLLVLYQCHDYDMLPVVLRRRSLGLSTVVEYNDNYYAPPPASPVSTGWSSPLIWNAYEQFIELGDVTVVTGPGLSELFSRLDLAQELVILENHLHEMPPALEESWQDPTAGEVHIGWAGSVGHMADLISIAPVIRTLLARNDKLRFFVMGNESIPDVLGLGDRLVFRPWGSMAEYYEFLTQIHIGLAPLLPTPYNMCRSDIKAVEISSRGALPILSDLLPYHHFAAATHAPLVKNNRELLDELEKLIHSPDQIKAAAEKCYRYVSTERIGPKNTKRRDLFARLLGDKQQNSKLPFSVGYQEIAGTQEDTMPSTGLMAQVRALHKSGDRHGSQQMIARARAANPLHPEFALLEIQLNKGNSSFAEKLAEGREQFPNDFRFTLLELSASAEALNSIQKWNDAISDLESKPGAFQRFFGKDLVKLFRQALKNNATFTESGLRLVKLFPSASMLRLELALVLERQGRSIEAAELLKELNNLRIQAEWGETQEIDSRYLQTVLEGTRAQKVD